MDLNAIQIPMLHTPLLKIVKYFAIKFTTLRFYSSSKPYIFDCCKPNVQLKQKSEIENFTKCMLALNLAFNVLLL